MKIDESYDPDAIFRDVDDSLDEFEENNEIIEDDPDLLYSTDDDE